MTHRAKGAPAGNSAPPKGMVWVPGGEFLMGSNHFIPRMAGPSRRRRRLLDQRDPVTVVQFQRFVRATGYRTWAEEPPDPQDYPAASELLVPGSPASRLRLPAGAAAVTPLGTHERAQRYRAASRRRGPASTTSD